jgi:hypothetical protein
MLLSTLPILDLFRAGSTGRSTVSTTRRSAYQQSRMTVQRV